MFDDSQDEMVFQESESMLCKCSSKPGKVMYCDHCTECVYKHHQKTNTLKW